MSEFGKACACATDEQLVSIYEGQVRRKRWKYARMAREECTRRGIMLDGGKGHQIVSIASTLMDIEHRK